MCCNVLGDQPQDRQPPMRLKAVNRVEFFRRVDSHVCDMWLSNVFLLVGAVNEAGPHGTSPLHEASRAGSPRVVSVLLGRGAAANSTDDRGRSGSAR